MPAMAAKCYVQTVELDPAETAQRIEVRPGWAHVNGFAYYHQVSDTVRFLIAYAWDDANPSPLEAPTYEVMAYVYPIDTELPFDDTVSTVGPLVMPDRSARVVMVSYTPLEPAAS